VLTPPDYNSPGAIKAFLESQGFGAQKQFGQNFLVNPRARARILDALCLERGDVVWEVGPGLGAMTSGLIERSARVTAFEVDRGYVDLLKGFFADAEQEGRFTLVAGDVLKTWPGELERGGLPQAFFGNLPYNIAATLIGDTIAAGVRFDRAVFTMQKEVARRMAAEPGMPDYSSLTVLCTWAYHVKLLFDLAPGNFWPAPKVASTVVSFIPRPECPPLSVALVRCAFASRRKTLRNNLLPNFGPQLTDAALAATRIDGTRRAETLSVDEFLALDEYLSNTHTRRPLL
jgi:16S rRNA (adenine1518-N6/adenine1519-N6)-dimethyltransferase